MRGVVLAGGLGTRLHPLTFATNKHLLPVFDKPMIFYPIETLVRAGITEVMVITGGPHAGDFIRVLKNGKELGLTHLEYAYQEGEGGIADALSLAEDFAGGKPIIVILGDNTTDADISQVVQSFREGAVVFLKEVPDPQRFGVPRFSKEGRIVEIIEKPVEPPSQFAVTGLYIYDAQVFNYIRTLAPSARGELEITDVNNCYLRDGKLSWALLEGFWSDAGTFESLVRVSVYWAKKAEVTCLNNL
ncbi:spore coat protein [candidate division WWE3 bacterium CG10_big_fil_rev_8_21_14_0_10_48_23]|uniref:glucose-1-phosphate thymidylyltransferase n=1 Tax=candidate division WWE3 bacterium CG_4_9_14_0_2_um_filter_48_10 TaxID=1975078 RepID=A0A2M8EJ39_UNCKA|nr:MAG: spore coat protein [candidate division WWE3 bacterium CG_4_9_14_0_2_um_filter_48_10]PJE51796.1 MAG: spore coat protein [candidate division WWE3 bacterium CG10_big_fil_rev_8_21_14_0_10_48_23]